MPLDNIMVFSTYVEMILNLDGRLQNGGSILHVCGDDPIRNIKTSKEVEYSPRMWR